MSIPSLRSPLISIITVCRNEEQTITRTCKSIAEQTFTDFEWIIIDGASTDNTLSLIQNGLWAGKITKLISEPDHGVFDAMNKGVQQSSGDYLLFMNGGDLLYTADSLEQATNYNLDAPLVVGGTEIRFPNKPNIIRTYTEGHFSNDYLYWRSLPHQSCLIRRENLVKTDGYDTSFKVLGDWNFFACEIVKNNTKVQVLPCVMSVFYHDGLSAQASGSKLYKKERAKIRARYYSRTYRLRRETNEFIGRCQHKMKIYLRGKNV